MLQWNSVLQKKNYVMELLRLYYEWEKIDYYRNDSYELSFGTSCTLNLARVWNRELP